MKAEREIGKEIDHRTLTEPGSGATAASAAPAVGKKQTAARCQADADDDGFDPPRLMRAERRDHEACEGRDDQTQRPDRDAQRTGSTATRTAARARHSAQVPDRRSKARPAQRRRPVPATARRTCAARFRRRRKSRACPAVARCPQREQRERHQRDAADKILRATDPFRHDGFDRRVARRVTHRLSLPEQGFPPMLLVLVADPPSLA